MPQMLLLLLLPLVITQLIAIGMKFNSSPCYVRATQMAAQESIPGLLMDQWMVLWSAQKGVRSVGRRQAAGPGPENKYVNVSDDLNP